MWKPKGHSYTYQGLYLYFNYVKMGFTYRKVHTYNKVKYECDKMGAPWYTVSPYDFFLQISGPRDTFEPGCSLKHDSIVQLMLRYTIYIPTYIGKLKKIFHFTSRNDALLFLYGIKASLSSSSPSCYFTFFPNECPGLCQCIYRTMKTCWIDANHQMII